MTKKRCFVYLSAIACFLAFSFQSFGAHPPEVRPIPSDEQQIIEDREAAIQAAVSEMGPQKDADKSKSLVAKKIDLQSGQTDGVTQQKNGKASAASWAKPDWFRFFGGRKKGALDGEVRKKRKARLEKFKNLDPAHVKESISEVRLAAKQEFISSGNHNLDGIIERAISIHLPSQIAYERIALSERRIIKAFRDFFMEAEFTRSQKDGTISGGPYNSRNWRMTFRQPLFRGGVLWNTFQLEMANRQTAIKEYEKSVSDVVAETSRAYFEYERAWNVLKDRKILFDRVTESKRISDEKNKANLISEIEKLNVDSLYSQANYDLETAEQDLELAKLELQRFLGLEITDPVDVAPLYKIDNINIVDATGKPVLVDPGSSGAQTAGVSALPASSPSSVTVEGKSVEHYIDLAYASRSDLQVEASKLHAARLSSKIASGRMLPEAEFILELGQLGEAFEALTNKPQWNNEFRLALEMSWNAAGNTLKYTFDNDQRAPSLTQFLNNNARSLSTTKTFSVSLLDNLNALSELKETKISALEQVVELEKTERDVIREVKEAYYNYNKALIQLESNYKRMNYRDKLAQLAKHRLETNEIQISEYLQADIDFTEERAQIHKALSDFYTAKANLNRAVGVRDYLRIESHQFESR